MQRHPAETPSSYYYYYNRAAQAESRTAAAQEPARVDRSSCGSSWARDSGANKATVAPNTWTATRWSSAADAPAAPPSVDASAFMTQVGKQAAAAPPPMRPPSSNKPTTAPAAKATAGPPPLLPAPRSHLRDRHLLVLDMDETLLHASVTPTSSFDQRFRVRMDGGQCIDVYVKFRPHVEEFLAACSRHFEVAVFTASIGPYANQVLDHLDPHGEYVHHRLYREHCTEIDGSYVKDLSRRGRPIHRVAIVDNSPTAYAMHPQNAIPITSWFDDQTDRELRDLIPSIERLARLPEVYDHLERHHGPNSPLKATAGRSPFSRR